MHQIYRWRAEKVMALIDRENGVVRVKIVYDGPPRAGKTTTIHALEQKLSSNRFVQPLNGMGIDLLEYQGGMYDHLPIACQILTTPGHPQWQKRRQFLLNQADAVVLVLDTRPEALPLGLEYLRQLREFLKQLPPPAPLFLVQANFQDLPNALDAKKLHSFFIDSSLRIMETDSLEGLGVRETFVMAVRLVVERLNLLKENYQLLQGKLDLPCSENWLEVLQSQQTIPENTFLSLLIDAPKITETSPEIKNLHAIHADLTEINLPNAETPLQWLYPALNAQLALKQLPDLTVILQDDGSWLASNDKWALFSQPDWHYLSEKLALSALQQQMRWHSQALFGLPETRYLALSNNEHGWHLWQIVQRPDFTFSNESVETFVEQLLTTSKHLSQSLQRLSKLIPSSQLVLQHFDLQGNFYGRLNPLEATSSTIKSIDKTLELCLPLLNSAPFDQVTILETLEQQEHLSPQFAQLFANHLIK
jgi:signal recognition particle receptor subunit beta